MRRAKIVATFGPATESPERVRSLVAAGLDVARLNLSHGEKSDHERLYREIRAAGDESGHAVGVLVDLQGPWPLVLETPLLTELAQSHRLTRLPDGNFAWLRPGSGE